MKNRLIWDNADPYIYVAAETDYDVLIVGGDHKTGHADDARTHFRTTRSMDASVSGSAGNSIQMVVRTIL